MSEAALVDLEFPPATDGAIAAINQASTRQHAWSRFWQAPERPGLAEYIAEQEGMALEFLSDFTALDRLDGLAEHLSHSGADAVRVALIRTQAASAAHRFTKARQHLAQARALGAAEELVERLALGIDQACGMHLDAALARRRVVATATGRLEDHVPLGALLADLGEYDAADAVYRDALRQYRDVSPFAMAWVCFRLGVLWGETAPKRQSARAMMWYGQAIAYLPCYVKARVHLAELYLADGRPDAARALLLPALPSGDPEVQWRLGDALTALGQLAAADNMLAAAQAGFEALIDQHELAFVDHGAEFYAGSGNDVARAFALAQIDLANRPTPRAFMKACAAAQGAGEARAEARLRDDAMALWGETLAFRQLPLGKDGMKRTST